MNRPKEKMWVDIDLVTLRENIRNVHQHIGAGRRILFVVKSDGYGHGAAEVARAALAEGVESFGVATLAEGMALRQSGVSEEIILLQPSLDDELEEVIAAGLQPSLSTLATAEKLSALALGRPVKVHIELNTGMNRMGFDPEEAIGVIPQIAELPDLSIAGVFTHFRPINFESTGEINQQLQLFNRTIAELHARGVTIPRLHAASSLSILHFPESYFDTIRPGLLMYGGFNGSLPANGPQTAPVMSCRCRVLHVRSVQQGEWIHYGDSFQAPSAMTVAIIAAGYGAGYPKALSNTGEVLIHGQRAPICGVVGMDMTIVDVSGLPHITPGETVTLMGRGGDNEITVTELAKKADTIPYEIICRLGRTLPRMFHHPELSLAGGGNANEVVLAQPTTYSP